MANVDEFDRFYNMTRRKVLAVTYAMCADRDNAARATRLAYRSAWRQWYRLRRRDSSKFVYSEAWRHTGLGRAAPILRRRRERGADTDLLAALGELDHSTRHLLSLMTIGDLALDEAARHVDLDDERALEQASRGFSRLEGLLNATIGEVIDRMESLREITDIIPLTPPKAVRRRATLERRRNVLALIGGAIAVTLVAGVLTTSGPIDVNAATLPQREQLGAESADIVLDAQRMSEKDLLTVAEVTQLRPDTDWAVEGTDVNPKNTTPYSTCPTRRFADDDPLRVFVRAYNNGKGDRVAQSIEVSRTEDASRAAFTELVNFYADCEHPRVQLVDAWKVARPFGDFTILRLRSNRSPARFITVGFAQSGSITSTLVHERQGTEATDVNTFAETLNESIARVCEISGGNCSGNIKVEETVPPPAGDFPNFLGVVDLPPVATIDKVWSASGAQKVTDSNPAATPCKQPSFTGKKFRGAESRLYTIPEAEELPDTFAIAQTVGTMASDADAEAFLSKVGKDLAACVKGEVLVKVDQKRKVRGEGFTGQTWRITFEISDTSKVSYRVGIVRHGAVVSQVLYPPAGKYTISSKKFASIVERAGQRLPHEPAS